MADNEHGRPQCHVCGKTFHDRRGLCGHLWAKHKLKASECPEFTNDKEIAVRSGGLQDLFRLQDEISVLQERSKNCCEWLVKGVIGYTTKDTHRVRAIIDAEIQRKKVELRAVMDSMEASMERERAAADAKKVKLEGKVLEALANGASQAVLNRMAKEIKA